MRDGIVNGLQPWIGAFEWTSLGLLVLLAASVIAHYAQIDDLEAYRGSPLIFIEILGVLFALLSIPVHLVRAMYFAVRARFRRCLSAVGCGFLTVVIMIWAMWYDAPTILYST